MNILILHGWGLSSKRYQPLVSLLKKKNHHVVVPDLPGFGSRSTLSNPLSLDDYSLFVKKLIQDTKLNNPLIIGHSFGGRITLRLLKNYPAIATHIVLAGTPGYRTDPSSKIQVFKLLAKTGKPVTQFLFRGNVPNIITKSLYYFSGSFDYYKANPILKKTFQSIVNDSLIADMNTIETNTLLIWGKYDAITPLWIGEKMKETIKNATLVVINKADHAVIYKQPEKFVNKIGTI